MYNTLILVNKERISFRAAVGLTISSIHVEYYVMPLVDLGHQLVEACRKDPIVNALASCANQRGDK
jgi:hypothetical protein